MREGLENLMNKGDWPVLLWSTTRMAVQSQLVGVGQLHDRKKEEYFQFERDPAAFPHFSSLGILFNG